MVESFSLILSEFSCYFDENLKLNRNELDDDDGQEDSKIVRQKESKIDFLSFI